MKKTGPTNENLSRLVKELKTLSYNENAKLWKRVATDLSKSTRNRRIVNLTKIDKFTKEGEQIIIPGKVLGAGELNHKLDIAAFSFSDSSIEKIEEANGKVLSIEELMKLNPKGKNIRIIG